jgi:predicted Zn-dependent peptidase
MVFFAVGNIKSERLFRLVEKHLGVLNHRLERAERRVPADVPVFHEVVNIDSHQAHTVVGKKMFSMHDDRKYAAFLLNNILGGPGMNSLLNVAIREKRGYAYTVESSVSLMSDCGLFQIYFGSDESHVNPSLRLIRRIMDELASKPLSEKALEAA